MRLIIDFLVRNKVFILFLILFIFSLSLIFQRSLYHKSSFLNSSNKITGSIYSNYEGIFSYYKLNEKNKNLLEENKNLRNILFNQREPNIVNGDLNYSVEFAKIIKNSYNNKNI